MAGSCDCTHAMVALPGRSRSPTAGFQHLSLTAPLGALLAAHAGSSQVLTPAALTEAVMQVLPVTEPANASLGEICKRRPRLETRPSCRASALRDLPNVNARHGGTAASPRQEG